MATPEQYGIDAETWEKILQLCAQYHVRRFALFGSIIHDDFTPESDIDVLVEFEPGKTPGLAFFKFAEQLSGLLHRRVDLNTPNSLSKYFRSEVLSESQELYVAA